MLANPAVDLGVPANVNFVTRYQPSANIGDIYLGGLTYVYESDNDLHALASLGWTRTESNGEFGLIAVSGATSFGAPLSSDLAATNKA
jgi:hypothetical protein